MFYRVEAQCEQNHSWSVLSGIATYDPGVCEKCGASPVLVVSRELPDRVFITIEPAMFHDEYSGKAMREKLHYVSLVGEDQKFLTRSPNPMIWDDAIKLVQRLKDQSIDKVLKIWNVKFK